MWLRQHCEAESGGERSHPENIAEDEHGAAHPRELLLRGAVETPTGECQREEEGGTNGLSLRHTLFSFLCSVIV